MAESGALEAPGGSLLEAVESRPWGWLLAIAACAVLTVGGMLAWWAVFGFWDTLFDPNEPLGISFDGRNHLTVALLVAFLVPATLWLRRGSVRDVRRLGERAGVPAPMLADAVRRNAAPPPVVRRVALFAALVVGALMIPLTSHDPSNFLKPGHLNMHHVWAVANNVVVFFILIEGAWLTFTGWRTFDRFTRSFLLVDLLDREGHEEIGRTGLRGSVVWLVGSSIASLMAWGMGRVTPLLFIIALTLAMATVSLVRPAHVMRGRLREAKRAELVRVRGEIARARESVLSSEADGAEQAARLPGLLAYEARVEAVREWPFDAPTLFRFGLLAVLAVGSWLGGALVERAVGVVLD